MKRAMLLLGLAACGDDNNVLPDANGADSSMPPDGASGCPRTAAPADRARHIVVSHPYTAASEPSPRFEVLDVSPAGVITRPNRTFDLGRASFGNIEFTPDGEVGLVALEDGKLGVFRLDAAGVPTVVHAGLTGSFYATGVVMDPRGDRAWILEGNTRENGGGVYLVTIGCDGAITDHGLVAPAKLPGAMVFAGDRAVLAAGDAFDGSTAGHDVQLLDLEGKARIGGADAFGDDDAIIGGAALTSDGDTFLVGDVSGFANVPNRVAIVGVTSTGLTPISVVTPLENPEGIATSPFGDVAIVTSAFGDAIFVLDTGGTNGAWRNRGEVTYAGADPMLPGDLTMITRGSLRGHVFVHEVSSIRHLAFRDAGVVEDLGSFQYGAGVENIGGVIGVTP